jgi:hypothetical protein
MDDAAYWRQQATKFRDRAETTKHPELHEELLELAAVCDEVATTIEDGATDG